MRVLLQSFHGIFKLIGQGLNFVVVVHLPICDYSFVFQAVLLFCKLFWAEYRLLESSHFPLFRCPYIYEHHLTFFFFKQMM